MWIDAGGAIGEPMSAVMGPFAPNSAFVIAMSLRTGGFPGIPALSSVVLGPPILVAGTGMTNKNGFARATLPVPHAPSLAGLPVYVQGVVQQSSTLAASQPATWHIAPNTPRRFVQAVSAPTQHSYLPYNHKRVMLQDGNFLYSGGSTSHCPPWPATAAVQLLNPTTGIMKSLVDMVFKRSGHAAVVLGSGNVFIVGGNSGTPTAELYDPAALRSVSLGQVPHNFYDPVVVPVTDPLTRNEYVFIGGGYDGNLVATDKSVLYDVTQRTFTTLKGLVRPRKYASAIPIAPGAILLTGGQDQKSNVLDDAEIFLVGTRTSYPWGKMLRPRQAHALVAIGGGQILIIGGNNGSYQGAYRDIEVFDGNRGLSSPFPFQMRFGRQAFEPARLADGTILLWSGGPPELLTPTGITLLRPIPDSPLGMAVHPMKGGAVAIGEHWISHLK